MTTGDLKNEQTEAPQQEPSFPSMQEDSLGACRGLAFALLMVFVGAVVVGGIVALIRIFVH